MVGVVVVGAGTAGAEVAIALRQRGYERAITLVGEEPHLPYQRPPLSKAFLNGDGPIADVLIRPASTYIEKDLEVRLDARVVKINRAERSVALDDGSSLTYNHLVVATGARNRRIAAFGDSALDLRTADDAVAIRERIRYAGRVAVIGGGFIGLELAAVARSHGADVTVIEARDRLMPRMTSRMLSDFLRSEHEEHGVRVALGCQVTHVDGQALTLSDHSRVETDMIIAGVGVLPNDDLARAAGLRTADGIVVNDLLLTDDPNISAIGDCARFPGPHGDLVRLESVQNATDHARHVAARLTGSTAPYAKIPWFWTEQYGRRIHIAGVATDDAETVRRGDPQSGRFSVCRLVGGRLVAIESVDHMQDHIAARKLLALTSGCVTPDQIADNAVELKDLAKALTGALSANGMPRRSAT